MITNLVKDNHLCMCIIDVLRHDTIEQLSSILNMINDDGCIGWRDTWEHDFTEEEILKGLSILLPNGYVSMLEENQSGQLVECNDMSLLYSLKDEVWFHLLRKGLEEWDSWQPPEEGEVVF